MIEKLDKVLLAIRKAGRRYMKTVQPVVIVGYTANYALYVHENVEMKWKGLPRGVGMSRKGGVVYYSKSMLTKGAGGTGKGYYWDPPGRGQAKFLEQPFRENRDKLMAIVAEHTRSSHSVEKGLLVAGLYLQRLSQQLVPVDTGNLKASAFTRSLLGAVDAIAASRSRTVQMAAHKAEVAERKNNRKRDPKTGRFIK